ncbi:hypothetical protein N7466_009719 [Penicillium verhagenii]|uniref:uncharacterized protein n=1 Tax=Penicillium verhagenii TaxID=1562060 RepID=UPI002545B77E|nr:uncharacterized protein N7466_009719 [Penicillium verhagenii]KAJ5921393.1 hypothetical protein N7466_009719 [Penicillium verhagenii]
MASAADAIVLSSSPEPPAHTPKNAVKDPRTLYDMSPLDKAPLPVPSLSEVFRPPSRSRFFPEPSGADKPARKKRQPVKTTDTTVSDATKAPAKRSKKAPNEQDPIPATLGELELGALDSRDNTEQKAQPSKTSTKAPKKVPTKAALKKSASKTSKATKDPGIRKLTGKVTKARSEPQTKNASKVSKKTEFLQEPATENIQVEQIAPLGQSQDLHLDEAVTRRRDWTPPRESGLEDDIAVEKEPKRDEKAGFGKLMVDYNYSGSASNSREVSLNPDGEGPTKRRRIELVDPALHAIVCGKSDHSDSSSSAPTKKKPKTQKRFTTLTARMTAQYAANESVDDSSTEEVVPDISKAKSRRKVKPANEEPIFTVLSPEAAVKALNEQDLIFGTCSQLEREESPQTLRDIQQAIRASESISTPMSAGCETPTRLAARLTGKKNLWGVAARDINGSLVQAAESDVDLTDTSRASKRKQNASTSVFSAFDDDDDDWFDLDYGRRAPPKSTTTLQEKLSEPVVDTQLLPASKVSAAKVSAPVVETPVVAVENSQQADVQRPSMPHYNGFTDAELSKQVAVYGFKSIRGRKKMIDLLQQCWESKHGTSDKPMEASSQAQTAVLKTTVQSVKPKPKPKPKAQSKPTTSSISVSTSKSTQSKPPALASPKQAARARGAPRSSYMDVEEIEDSEEELFPSPVRDERPYTKKLSTKLSQDHTLDIVTEVAPKIPSKRKTTTKTSRSKTATSSTSALKPDKARTSSRSSLPHISAQITKAVRSQSKLSPLSSLTGSRSCPTWHEKIMMYDPIILEDLTTWLNVEGLGLIEEDREVGSLDYIYPTHLTGIGWYINDWYMAGRIDNTSNLNLSP